MSIGRSFYDQRGKIYLGEPMVASIVRGRVRLHRYPTKIRHSNSYRAVKHRMDFAIACKAWMTLSEKERAEWETYAEMMYDVRTKEMNETGGRGIVIPRRVLPSTGIAAFVQSNILLRSMGISDIHRKAPFNAGFPPAPMNVSLEYKDGTAEVRWDDPVVEVDGVLPTVAKVRIWAMLYTGKKKAHGQIMGVVDIPSSGVFTFDSIRIGGDGRVSDVKLADFPSGMLYVRLDTVVVWGEGVGAVRSVGSNIDRKSILKM